MAENREDSIFFLYPEADASIAWQREGLAR